MFVFSDNNFVDLEVLPSSILPNLKNQGSIFLAESVIMLPLLENYHLSVLTISQRLYALQLLW